MGFDPSREVVVYGPEHPDYPNAPSDWDGGAYLCRDGEFYHMRGYGWAHGLGCWSATASWDRIGYRRAASAIEAQRAGTPQSGPVHESAVAESQTPNPSLRTITSQGGTR
jgi:hypothetical protein